MSSQRSSRNSWLEQGERGDPSRSVTFRKHARRAVSLRVLVTHVQAGWQRRVDIENVGLGGACLIIDEGIGPGDVITISFASQAAPPLVLRARVAWIASPTSARAGERRAFAGAAFDHVSAGSLFGLFELISNLLGE